MTFRAKLGAIVSVATLSLVLGMLASFESARRVESQLGAVQRRYLPRVELGHELEATFERLRRSFQDAVAAHDPDALKSSLLFEDAMLRALDGAGEAVAPADAASARAALVDYCASATDISRRLISDETGEQILAEMGIMQNKQRAALDALRNATAVDRAALRAAFASISKAEKGAGLFRLAISVASLVILVALSVWLGRGVLRSLEELTAGFKRFGGGKFDREIRVLSQDELGAVAAHANEMARSLERLTTGLARAKAKTEAANNELEAFSYSVAHDLRAPLRAINGFATALLEDSAEQLDESSKEHLSRIMAGAERMGHLIDALLGLARLTRAELRVARVDLSAMAKAAIEQLRATEPGRAVDVVVAPSVVAEGDPELLRAIFDNLVGNAWKFTRKTAQPRIEFGREDGDGGDVYYVRDNGAGFDMALKDSLFAPFRRLHRAADFEGTGVGLATVQRIVRRHGGRIWAQAAVGEGATFRFTLAARAGGGAEAS